MVEVAAENGAGEIGFGIGGWACAREEVGGGRGGNGARGGIKVVCGGITTGWVWNDGFGWRGRDG